MRRWIPPLEEPEPPLEPLPELLPEPPELPPSPPPSGALTVVPPQADSTKTTVTIPTERCMCDLRGCG